jgi:hypothetical protein
MDQQEQTVVLKSPTIPKHQTAIRFWKFGSAGELVPPLHPNGFSWRAGINKGVPWGLYGFHYGQSLKGTCYFSITDGTFQDQLPEDRVIGGIAYWGDKRQTKVGGMVVASFAAITCLLEYPGMSERHLEKINQAAERYQVEVTCLDKLAEAVDRYMRETLPQFDTSELLAGPKA